MIEVLITVLVLAIGLLGLAALQVTGLKESQMAYMRSQAVLLTYDMADRIRANPTQAGDYVGNYDSTDADTAAADLAPGLAGLDLEEWIDSSLSFLPGWTGEITNPATDNYWLTIRWNETRDPAVVDTDCPNDDSDGKDLQCYVLKVAL